MEGEKRETQSPAVPVLTLEAEGRDSADGTRDAEALQRPYPPRGGRCVRRSVHGIPTATRLASLCPAFPLPEPSYAAFPLLLCPQH